MSKKKLDTAKQKAELIVAAAREHKAFDLALLDLVNLSSITDFFFICSCKSNRQVQAVADHIVESVKKKGGYNPLGVEGKNLGHWVLLDFGEVIAHVFYEPMRELYDLEGLWIEARHLDLDAVPKAAPAPRKAPSQRTVSKEN